ncbi:hypothetical protein D9M68_626200 [compost metagenome]
MLVAADPVLRAEAGDGGGVVGALLAGLFRRQAADGRQVADVLGRRRAVGDAVGLADEDALGAAAFRRPDIVRLGGDVQGGQRAAGWCRYVGGELATGQFEVIGRVDVADDGHRRYGAHRIAVGVALRFVGRRPGADTGQPQVIVLARTATVVVGAGRRRGAGEIAHRLVHHLADGVAPHVAGIALGDRPRCDPAAAVGLVAVVEVDDPQLVDGCDDAVADAVGAADVGAGEAELAGIGVVLLAEALQLAAQYAAAEVLLVRTGQQAEVHLVGGAIVVKDAGRLEVAAVGYAVAVAQGGVVGPAGADRYLDVFVGEGAGAAGGGFPIQVEVCVATVFFVPEHEVVCFSGFQVHAVGETFSSMACLAMIAIASRPHGARELKLDGIVAVH